MMDFDNILDIATQNQGHGNAPQKRYSLQAGPPKKDPRSKGVNPAAIQALLKKQSQETKKKETQMKKQKADLLAKRVEMKSDRKARAMASRTKDNFRGYNGIPVLATPKKRRSKHEMQDDMGNEEFKNNFLDPEDDEDNYEYEQSESESEQEPEPLRPVKTTGVVGSSGSSGRPASKKPSGLPKPAPPPMNFADLLKLAEKKQFEPVELKSKPKVKKEERLRTADEIRELEMERKAKRPDKDRDGRPQSNSSSVKKAVSERDQKNCKPQKNSSEKPNVPSGSGKKSRQTPVTDRDRERERPKSSHSDRDRSKASSSSQSGATNTKGSLKATPSQVLAKQGGARPSSSHKSSTSSDLSSKRESSSSLQGRTSGTRPPGTTVPGQKSQHGTFQQTRPSQGSSLKQGPSGGGHKSGNRESLRPGVTSPVKSSGNTGMRSSSGGPHKAAGPPQARPGGVHQAKAGGVPQARPGGRGMNSQPGGSGSRPPGPRPGSGGPIPGRSAGSMGSGPGRPKCTVVSETISSKNLGGPRMGAPPRPGMPQRPGNGLGPGMPPRPGMLQRPGMPHRPGMPPRIPGSMLPPITSAYKRKYEDEEEEYDSEMDDFIDDGGDEQEEISRHIKEIFGYDKSRYRDESDYALKFMESSWKDMQKEEARSLRMAVQEDLEEERKEQEELKRMAKRKKKD